MIKTPLIGFAAAIALLPASLMLVACAPNPPPDQDVQPIPPGPTSGELADYATAQMHYRQGLATGDSDAVARANETFRQIPREIFFRENPRLFDAKLVCERNQVAAAPFELRCRNIEWRYNEATTAIRQDLEARVTAADYATIRQAVYP
jgi:hypothetical protein